VKEALETHLPENVTRPKRIPMKTALITTTYNQSDLGLQLESLARQSTKDFTIYIADDGSGDQTRELIESKKPLFFDDQIQHIWHEDEGYRKSLILNKTLEALPADIEWIIFVDADTLLHPLFVADHQAMAAPNRIFKGRRVEMNAWLSDWCRTHSSILWTGSGFDITGKAAPVNMSPRDFSQDFYQNLLLSSWQKDASGAKTLNRNRARRIANPWIRKVFKYNEVPDLLGSNFSICRKLIDKLKGFDTSSERYWGEDGDLYVRALEAGAETVGRKCWAVQFHLWHPRKSYDLEAEREYQSRLKKAQSARAD